MGSCASQIECDILNIKPTLLQKLQINVLHIPYVRCFSLPKTQLDKINVEAQH